MTFHEELLGLAGELIHRNEPSQAHLRRAVSTAYYAFFHLLVSEATLNWKRDSSRDALGRMFDHGLMRKVTCPFYQSYASEGSSVLSCV